MDGIRVGVGTDQSHSVCCKWYQTSLYPSQTIIRLQCSIEFPRRARLARTFSMSSHEGFDITGLVTTIIVSSWLSSVWSALCFVGVHENSESLADFVSLQVVGSEYKVPDTLHDFVFGADADADEVSPIISTESPKGSVGARVDTAASIQYMRPRPDCTRSNLTRLWKLLFYSGKNIGECSVKVLFRFQMCYDNCTVGIPRSYYEVPMPMECSYQVS